MSDLLRAARAGQRAERRRVLRMLEEMTWGVSISPHPAAPLVEERFELLRRRIESPKP